MTGTISPSARSNCKSRSFLVRKEPKEFSTKHAHRVENPVGMFFCAVLVLWRKVFHKGETGWGKSAGFSGERGCMGQKAGICPGKAAGRGKFPLFRGSFPQTGSRSGKTLRLLRENCRGRNTVEVGQDGQKRFPQKIGRRGKTVGVGAGGACAAR